jgi:non-ribosomal peptide synthetase component E (peptide arylation enzyme)
VDGGRRLSYREPSSSDRLANAVLAAGVKKGDTFTTVRPNCHELMAAYGTGGRSTRQLPA